MSDVLNARPTFLTLYEQSQVAEDQIDEFIAAWHESGEDEQRPLAAFLGMTDEEYCVSLMAPDSLPLIRRARCEHLPLRELLGHYLNILRSKSDPLDQPVVHALSHWLSQRETG